VRIARSSILLLHALQLYVQLLQMREPSPRRRRFASESRRVPHVLHRKQFRCHRFPAVFWSASCLGGAIAKHGEGEERGTRNERVGEEGAAPPLAPHEKQEDDGVKELVRPPDYSRVRLLVGPFVGRAGSLLDHKETRSQKKARSRQLRSITYQAQRPCPPPGSGPRFSKS
jgi:hypothetical protein